VRVFRDGSSREPQAGYEYREGVAEKVYHVDPLVCARCGQLIRTIAFVPTRWRSARSSTKLEYGSSSADLVRRLPQPTAPPFGRQGAPPAGQRQATPRTLHIEAPIAFTGPARAHLPASRASIPLAALPGRLAAMTSWSGQRELWLVRHGETPASLGQTLAGWEDVAADIEGGRTRWRHPRGSEERLLDWSGERHQRLRAQIVGSQIVFHVGHCLTLEKRPHRVRCRVAR